MTAGMVRAPTIIPLRPPVLGKPKAAIDTNTKIEIRSDSDDLDIYFSLNNDRPEPFSSSGQRNTFKYREPFALPAGKRSVKAIAVTKDGSRESNVVTKTFEVELVKSETNGHGDADGFGFIEDIQEQNAAAAARTDDARQVARSYIRQLLKTGSAGVEAWTSEADRSVTGSSYRKPRQQARFTESRLTAGRSRSTDRDPTIGSMLDPVPPAPVDLNLTRTDHIENSTQAMRMLRETDFTKCIYCLAPRPSDPFARFCNSCGQAVPPLPQTRLPPPESGQLGTCHACGSTVPHNLPTCLVCESPMGVQVSQPQAGQRLRDRRLCTVCGTANPPHLESCLTCESRLPGGAPFMEQKRPYYSQLNGINVSIPTGGTPAHTMATDSRLLSCTKCGRLNSPEARYCDWCGAKPSAALSQLVCGKCGCHNSPMATYCSQCSSVLEPPPRLDPRQLPSNAPPQWMPAMPLPIQLGAKPITFDVNTQTVGLFYPSTTDMRKKETEDEEKRRTEKELRDRAPLLTVISPGRGYWRKQVDHMIAHLKAHASNNAEFRALIGEPRMGKLLSAEVHEDGYELNLSLTFALKDYRDPYQGQPLGTGHYLSTVTQGRRGSLDSFRSDGTASTVSGLRSQRTTGRPKSGVGRGKKRVVSAKKSTRRDVPKQTIQDKALIREVGKNGEGRPSEIQSLIDDQSADPNMKNKDGVPVIIMAVRNGLKDAIPALVNCGADVNGKEPEKGNTALHEAVLKGYDGEDLVEALVGCGALVKRKNDKGDTPYDLAVKDKNDAMIKKMAARMNQGALTSLLKPKGVSNTGDDY